MSLLFILKKNSSYKLAGNCSLLNSGLFWIGCHISSFSSEVLIHHQLLICCWYDWNTWNTSCSSCRWKERQLCRHRGERWFHRCKCLRHRRSRICPSCQRFNQSPPCTTNILPLSTKSPYYCNCTLRRGFKPYVAQWWTRASTIDELRCTSHCRALIPNWNRRVGHRTHNI